MHSTKIGNGVRDGESKGHTINQSCYIYIDIDLVKHSRGVIDARYDESEIYKGTTVSTNRI